MEDSAYNVICREHGRVQLGGKEYDRQLRAVDERWRCPLCHRIARFDEDAYEAAIWRAEQPPKAD